LSNSVIQQKIEKIVEKAEKSEIHLPGPQLRRHPFATPQAARGMLAKPAENHRDPASKRRFSLAADRASLRNARV
jgi:hypothetical protein